MLKNVIFDCGGVMFRWDPDAVLRRYFPSKAGPAIKPLVFRAWETLDDGTADYNAYRDETCRLVPKELQAAARRFFDRLYFELEPIEDTWALAARLMARGYRVYLLSNAPTPLVDNAADICPVMRAFDGLVISASIHLLKPGREIFEYAIRSWSIDPAESLLVDDMQQNVQGAIECGLHGYLYREDADALLRTIEEMSGEG